MAIRLLFSHTVVPSSLLDYLLALWYYGLHHIRVSCSPLSPGVCSNSCPLSQWCHLTISSSGALSSFSLSTDSLSFVLLLQICPHIITKGVTCVMKILEREVFQFNSWILFFCSLCFSFGSFYWHIWFFPWPGPVCSWDHQGHSSLVFLNSVYHLLLIFRAFFSLLTRPISPWMLPTFSFRALSVLIMVIWIPSLIIPICHIWDCFRYLFCLNRLCCLLVIFCRKPDMKF